MPKFEPKIPRRFNDGSGGGGFLLKDIPTDPQDAGTEGTLTPKESIEIQNIFDQWSAKFAALHIRAQEAVSDARAVDKQIEANMERRRKILKAEPNH